VKENKNLCCAHIYSFQHGLVPCEQVATTAVGGKCLCKKHAAAVTRSDDQAETSRRAALWPELVGLVLGLHNAVQTSMDPREQQRHRHIIHEASKFLLANAPDGSCIAGPSIDMNKEQGNGKA